MVVILLIARAPRVPVRLAAIADGRCECLRPSAMVAEAAGMTGALPDGRHKCLLTATFAPARRPQTRTVKRSLR